MFGNRVRERSANNSSEWSMCLEQLPGPSTLSVPLRLTYPDLREVIITNKYNEQLNRGGENRSFQPFGISRLLHKRDSVYLSVYLSFNHAKTTRPI